MTCKEFQHWLDDGQTERELAQMNDHRVGCLQCEQALGVATQVERLLAIVVPGAAGADFNDAVIGRIHAETKSRARRQVLSAFVNGMCEPVVPVSLAVSAVLAWRYRTVLLLMNAIFRGVLRSIDYLSRHDLAAIVPPYVMRLSALPGVSIVLAISLPPLIIWISWRIFQTYERMTVPWREHSRIR